MHSDKPTSISEIVRLFLRLGLTAFGGPVAHIAMMHREVVERHRWMGEQELLDLIGMTNLIPGPNSTELAIHIGYRRGGWRGMLAAGLSFILPAALMVGGLAWLYVRYGSTPQGEAVLYGIKPVVLAIILQALLRLGRTAVKDKALALLGLAVAALFLLGGDELALLFGGALAYFAFRLAAWGLKPPAAALLPAFLARIPISGGVTAVSLWGLFTAFLKVGSVLYGSGYVLLAFLRNDLVVRLGWLSDQHLLDAIAVGQLTPGPVFTTATFVGFVLGGAPGAFVATTGIFLPSFVFVLALSLLLKSGRRSPRISTLLDGVNVSALGLMAGVAWQLGRAALIDPLTVSLLLVSGVLLFRYKVSSAWLVLLGGLASLLWSTLR